MPNQTGLHQKSRQDYRGFVAGGNSEIWRESRNWSNGSICDLVNFNEPNYYYICHIIFRYFVYDIETELRPQ